MKRPSRRGSPARSRLARRATEKRAGLCLCAGGERKRRGGGHLRDRGGGGAQRSRYNYRVGTSMPRRSSTSIRRCRRCFSATIIPAAASCVPCSSTRSGAKRAMAICCRNHASYLWPPFASASMKVVAEMRGVIDEQGYSPFWESRANAFRHGVFPCRLPVRHRTKAFIAALMPKHPLYIDFLSLRHRR